MPKTRASIDLRSLFAGSVDPVLLISFASPARRSTRRGRAREASGFGRRDAELNETGSQPKNVRFFDP